MFLFIPGLFGSDYVVVGFLSPEPPVSSASGFWRVLLMQTKVWILERSWWGCLAIRMHSIQKFPIWPKKARSLYIAVTSVILTFPEVYSLTLFMRAQLPRFLFRYPKCWIQSFAGPGARLSLLCLQVPSVFSLLVLALFMVSNLLK